MIILRPPVTLASQITCRALDGSLKWREAAFVSSKHETWITVGKMLDQRLRRSPNIHSTPDPCLVFAR